MGGNGTVGTISIDTAWRNIVNIISMAQLNRQTWQTIETSLSIVEAKLFGDKNASTSTTKQNQ